MFHCCCSAGSHEPSKIQFVGGNVQEKSFPPPPPPPDKEGGDSKTHGGDKKTGHQGDVANGHSAKTAGAKTAGAKTAGKSDEIDMKVLDFLAVSQTVCMPLVQ